MSERKSVTAARLRHLWIQIQTYKWSKNITEEIFPLYCKCMQNAVAVLSCSLDSLIVHR